MIALLTKEFRQLFSIVFLWLALLLMSYASLLSTRRFDEQSYAIWCAEYCASGINAEIMSNVVLIMVLLLVTAYSLYPREYDESTIDFLNALPVRRSTIFLAKCLAAWLSMCAVLVFGYLSEYVLLSFNTQSLDGRNYPQVISSFLLRDCLFAFVVLAHGVFLSRFRTPGLLLYAFYLIGLLWWENAVGSVGVISLFAFYRNEFEGSELLLNWHAIGWHLAVAVLFYGAAGFLWCRAETTPGSSKRTGQARWVGIAAAVFAFIVLAAVMVGRFHTADALQQRSVLNTVYYDFVALAKNDSVVKELLVVADDDYDALVEMLGTEVTPSIVADLTASKSHVGGLAAWKKIQMDISDGESAHHYRRVLSHESTHVFQSVISERAFSRNSNSAHFFLEGMAQAASFRIVPDEQRRQANWTVAALAFRRHEIRFRDLANYSALSEHFDPELIYSLADHWVESLIDTCGLSVLGDVLRSAGASRAPDGLPGEVFWRELLRQPGCELERVNINWASAMDLLLPENEDYFPRFGRHVFVRNPSSQAVSVEVDLALSDLQADLLSEQQFYLRVANEGVFNAAPGAVYRGELTTSDETAQATFRLPAHAVEGSRVRYQLGFRPSEHARIFFERWQSTTISLAEGSELSALDVD